MKLRLPGRSWFASRRAIRALESIAADQHQIRLLFQRIADRLDPPPAEITAADLAKTDASYATDEAQARIADIVERIWRDTKRAPSDEEIVAILEGEPQ
jgi:hypothetical protein